MKLTSTNRPFGLIIKLSQTVFEEEQKKQRLFCTVEFDLESNLYASQLLLSHSRHFLQGVSVKRLSLAVRAEV